MCMSKVILKPMSNQLINTFASIENIEIFELISSSLINSKRGNAGFDSYLLSFYCLLLTPFKIQNTRIR